MHCTKHKKQKTNKNEKHKTQNVGIYNVSIQKRLSSLDILESNIALQRKTKAKSKKYYNKNK